MQSQWLKNHWQRLVFVPAAVVVIFGLLQHFVLPANFLSHFGYSSSTIAPYETVNSNLKYIRVMSTLRGANPLGAYLVVITSLVGAALLSLKRPSKYRIALSALLVGDLIVLFYSYSRSAWIASAISLVIVAGLSLKSGRLKQWLVVGLGVCVMLGALAYVTLRHNPTFQNALFHTQSHSVVKTTSDQNHASALKSGLRDVVHQPLGRGPGTAGPASVYNHNQPRIAENFYIQIAQEIGWLGLVIFLLVNWLVLKGLWLKRSINPLCLGLLGSFVGLVIVNLLSHAWADDTLAYIFWGLAGIGLADQLKNRPIKHDQAAR